MGKVYGYVRVSTGRQADEGESLEIQERRIQGHAMQTDLALERIFIERGVSGSVPLGERPAGEELLAVLEEGDTIVAAKLDRIFRSALDALQTAQDLRNRGVGLHLLDLGGDVNNGMGKLFFTMAAAFAEAERERIAERVRDTKRDQRERGRFLGGTVPFGFRVSDDGGLVEEPGQQKAIQRMIKMRKRRASLRKIAEAITKDGHLISHQGVKRVLDAQQATGA